LRKQGAYGWPYQVVSIELLPASAYDKLLPADATPAARAGFEDWKTYCMNCHRIDDVGGMKYPVDMRQLVNGKSRDELRAWINSPASLRPGTSMPPLNVYLDKQERSLVIERIVDYLESL
jgi:cytochrome c2